MNKWIKRIVAFAFVATQFLVIPPVSASSLENIQNQKKEVETEVTQLQKDVNDKLTETSELSTALERSEEHTSELQSRGHLVCRLLLEKKKHITIIEL